MTKDVKVKGKVRLIYYENKEGKLSKYPIRYKKYLTKKDAKKILDDSKVEYKQVFRTEIKDIVVEVNENQILESIK